MAPGETPHPDPLPASRGEGDRSTLRDGIPPAEAITTPFSPVGEKVPEGRMRGDLRVGCTGGSIQSAPYSEFAARAPGSAGRRTRI